MIGLRRLHKKTKHKSSCNQTNCSGAAGMFSNRMLLAELHSALYCHHAAEIRTVSAGSYVAFPEAEFVFTTRDYYRKHKWAILNRLNICDVAYSSVEPFSLPDKAVAVSAEGRTGVSLFRIGVQDSRVETPGCSARSFLRCS